MSGSPSDAPPAPAQASLASAAAVAEGIFRGVHYLRHNARRLEHLASLRLDLRDKSVLEVGAGIGDHTTFFLDRGCEVLSTEPRPENCQAFANAMGAHRSLGNETVLRCRLFHGDVDAIDRELSDSFDIVYCYGLLYHLADPAKGLVALAKRCKDLFLLETWVSFGDFEAVNQVAEDRQSASQAVEGIGCRPTRLWIFNRLRELYRHVYVPRTQPAHEEFPLDWTERPTTMRPTRAVFIGSRQPLRNDMLLNRLPDRQTPC